MEKIAIIDMGSNSIRFVALQIGDNGSYTFLFQEKEANLASLASKEWSAR